MVAWRVAAGAAFAAAFVPGPCCSFVAVAGPQYLCVSVAGPCGAGVVATGGV